MSNVDFAAIEVDDVYLDAWTSYRFDSDLFTPADGFSLTIGAGSSSSRTLRSNLETLRRVLYPGARIKFWIGHGDKRTLQGTGILDSRDITGSASGTSFKVEGRDLAALMFSAAPPSLYSASGTLVDLAIAAVAEWDISVKADPTSMRDVRTGAASGGATSERARQDKAQALGIPIRRATKNLFTAIANGTIDPDTLVAPGAGARYANNLSPLKVYALKVKDARVQSGETVWDFLDRHARRLGVLMRMSPDGVLNLVAPDYGQAPLYHLRRTIDYETTGRSATGISRNPNNILDGGERYDSSTMWRQVTVKGRFKSDADDKRAALSGTARDSADDALPFERTLVLQDDGLRSAAEATKRAYRELARSRMGARTLDYSVRGHGSDGHVFAVDTVATVTDEVAGISGPFYVVSRSFLRADDGPRTQLKLVPLDSIVIAE